MNDAEWAEAVARMQRNSGITTAAAREWLERSLCDQCKCPKQFHYGKDEAWGDAGCRWHTDCTREYPEWREPEAERERTRKAERSD